ncbi:SGNH/GDSL hydrolase family protein [bacterium]|nr:SGNH/GDSL hydrolase family protein [bacterium]
MSNTPNCKSPRRRRRVLAALGVVAAIAAFVAYFAVDAYFRKHPRVGFHVVSANFNRLPSSLRASPRVQGIVSRYVSSFTDATEPREVGLMREWERDGTYIVVAFGDSTTAAVNISGSPWWPEILQALMTRALEKPVRVVNAGIPGTSVRQGLERLSRDALSLEPELVLVSFGLNDGQVMNVAGEDIVTWVPFEEYRESLAEMIDRVRGAGADAILWTFPRVGTDYARERGRIAFEAQHAAYARMREAQRDIARDRNVPLADVHRRFEEASLPDVYVDADQYHPADTAQPIIAKAIFDAWDREIRPKLAEWKAR